DAQADAGGDAGTTQSPVCTTDGWCWSSPLPSGAVLRGVWAVSPTDVWAVGDGSTALHFDGTTWRAVTVPAMAFGQMWGSGSNDIWAAGGAYSASLDHWNGTAWSAV